MVPKDSSSTSGSLPWRKRLPQRPAPSGANRPQGAVLRPLWLGLLVFATVAAHAQSEPAGLDLERRRSFTAGELALLPEICKDIQGMPSYNGPRGDYWRSVAGNVLEHAHHYCRGMRDLLFLRTLQLKPEHRRLLWDRAAGEMMYMIKNVPPNNPMQPEFWLHYGFAKMNFGDLGEAQRAFEQSRTLKPDYWPAYTYWADFLISNKRFDEARAVIELGLKQLPGHPELTQRLERIAAQRR